MSRDDGFSIADTDTGMLSDPKILTLARQLRDPIRTGAAIALYDAVRLASWKAGRRLTLEETVPGWWLDPFDELAAALVSAGLIDDEHRIPAHAWESWYGPARDRRQRLRDLGSKGGKAAHEPVERTVERTVEPVPTVPTVRSDRPTVPAPPAENWGPRPQAWQGFRQAWEGRGLRRPPTEAQRLAMWPAIDARPETMAAVVRDAPAGSSAAVLVGHVLTRWREVQRTGSRGAPEVPTGKYDAMVESGDDAPAEQDAASKDDEWTA
ncbi:MAG: hypothetical protein ABSB75_02015 [Candidatus Limnocylindrales bacterium]